MSDKETISVYDKEAARYASHFKADMVNARLTRFVDRLPKGGSALDLGCGPGRSAGYMAARGIIVDALDASRSMLELVKQYDGVTAILGDFYSIPKNAAYDGVWANFSLLHASRDAFPQHLADIKSSLKEGGYFTIALKLGDGEMRDKIGRLYTYHSEDGLEAALKTAGFSIIQVDKGRDPGLDGTYSDWISMDCHA
ncbi:MAG: class I SAM-dependent DNA methyltransferase [Halocynthiibacter sp.]